MTIFFNNMSNGDSINVYNKNASIKPNTVSPIANQSYKKKIIQLILIIIWGNSKIIILFIYYFVMLQ
jgi:hypothetical protein